jgi:hypothetical protein
MLSAGSVLTIKTLNFLKFFSNFKTTKYLTRLLPFYRYNLYMVKIFEFPHSKIPNKKVDSNLLKELVEKAGPEIERERINPSDIHDYSKIEQELRKRKEDSLNKKIDEAYERSNTSLTEEHYKRLCRFKHSLKTLALNSDIKNPNFFMFHPELENKTKEELDGILDQGKNKKDKILASQESLVWKIICLLEQKYGENFSIAE